MRQANNNFFAQLISSLVIACICSLFLSQSLSNLIIKPLVFDGTLSRSGRYGFVYEAWDTIGENEDDFSIVAVGSSLTQYGINGSCMSLADDIGESITYNLGIPGSYPYLDMLQVERALSSNPKLVLLEVNPISLSRVSDISENNIQLRLTLASLFLERQEYGPWVDLLQSNHLDYLDYDLDKQFNSESIFFQKSFEELLIRYKNNNSEENWWVNEHHWYLGVPNPNSPEWEDYLVEPTWLSNYIANLGPEELSDYENETIPSQMSRSRYKPDLESNLNYQALEYIVSTLSENDIPVLLISYPIHPYGNNNLLPGQLDQHNVSLSTLAAHSGVNSVNYIWDENWDKEDFYDFEHLNSHGRLKMCDLLTTEIISLIRNG